MITHAAPQKHYTVLLSRPVCVPFFCSTGQQIGVYRTTHFVGADFQSALKWAGLYLYALILAFPIAYTTQNVVNIRAD